MTTWNYEPYSNWDFNPTTNGQFVGLTNNVFTGNMFPPTPGMVDLASRADALGFAIFWITGRGDAQHAATIADLQDDAAAGCRTSTGDLNGKTIPEVDAGYVAPTPLDIGHGGFTDGLFTKPPSASTRPTSTSRSSAARSSTRACPARPSSTSPGHSPNRSQG